MIDAFLAGDLAESFASIDLATMSPPQDGLRPVEKALLRFLETNSNGR